MTKLKFTKSFFAILLTAVMLCSVEEARAQFGFSAGPKGGMAISSFKGADAENIDERSSWFGGVFLNFQLGEMFALQPEFLLTQRGADYTSNNTRNSLSINYFEVPVLAKIRFPLANEVIFPHLLVGPNFGFRTDMDFSSRDTQSGVNLAADADGIRDTDIGGLVGAGIDIQTRGNGVFFTIDGRYGWSFQDLADDDNMIALRHAGWQFAAGVGFRFGNSDN